MYTFVYICVHVYTPRVSPSTRISSDRTATRSEHRPYLTNRTVFHRHWATTARQSAQPPSSRAIPHLFAKRNLGSGPPKPRGLRGLCGYTTLVGSRLEIMRWSPTRYQLFFARRKPKGSFSCFLFLRWQFGTSNNARFSPHAVPGTESRAFRSAYLSASPLGGLLQRHTSGEDLPRPRESGNSRESGELILISSAFLLAVRSGHGLVPLGR